MSDDLMERIETSLEQLVVGQADLQSKFGGLDGRVTGLEDKFSRLDAKVTELDTKVAELDTKVTALDTKVTGLDAKVTGLDAKVTGLEQGMNERFEEAKVRQGVLHEELIDRIKSLDNPDAPTRAEMRAGFAELHRVIDQRITPLETVVRQHSIDIEQLKQGRA